jgi:putative NIF3 family GTP cyclohydrolase 1 type 2
LGFGEPLLSRGYFRLYDVSGHTGASLARHVAERVARYGQQAVQIVGPPRGKISRLALGTGALTPFMHFVDELEADAAICTDDGFTYWRDGALAQDMGIPVIIVNHAVSEAAGMAGLAELLRDRFSDISVHFLQNGCMFRLVGPKQASGTAETRPG